MNKMPHVCNGKQNYNVSSDTDASTAATTFVITKGHISGKNGRRNKNPFFTIIYTSGLIVCASLKEIRLIV
jgi:hypothetical protein